MILVLVALPATNPWNLFLCYRPNHRGCLVTPCWTWAIELGSWRTRWSQTVKETFHNNKLKNMRSLCTAKDPENPWEYLHRLLSFWYILLTISTRRLDSCMAAKQPNIAMISITAPKAIIRPPARFSPISTVVSSPPTTVLWCGALTSTNMPSPIRTKPKTCINIYFNWWWYIV